ncbi:MAG: ATP-binding cassette domain-containing protein [Rickettsiales bacterium]|jgi:phospholipid/cholesterol/gamma-HCH transport system ATP-binding protein|nr:ATP-binding cassette domain-containing protein [Rickettsiales bacterium]
MANKIEIRNLTKSFSGKMVLNGLDLDIEEKKSLVILGKSGGGKSVLIKNMSMLMTPDSGSIKMDDQEITHLGETKRFKLMDKFGFLFQNGALFDSMKVWENIAFKLILNKKIREREAKKIAIDKLEIVDLDEKIADLYPHELSGGMQKRVALARAIACNPEVIFFDEPTTGLDPVTSNKINNLIVKTIEITKATAITITHDINSARMISDKMVLLADGKICWEGNRDTMYDANSVPIKKFLGGIE